MVQSKERLKREEDLAVFVEVMRTKLRENEDKGYWGDADLETLWLLLKAEISELECELMLSTGTPDSIAREAADVANFAMMIASVAKSVW